MVVSVRLARHFIRGTPSTAGIARAMATLPFVAGRIHEDSTVTPHKPLSDKREYRVITLPNRMRVALIHDPAADKAAACLTTAIGSLSDPWHLPGLSHFLEHMLFLGTDKYPEESSYKKFLKDHGGGCNASTSSEATTYHFFVHKDSLLGEGAALDRFSSFFTGPLMTESATDRELNAVDSENSKNLNDDGRREWQTRKHVSAPGHVFRKFGTGNRGTLTPGGTSVRSELVAHYDRYYSSNIQAAAVLGVESLDALEAGVRAGLERVQDKAVRIPVADEQGAPYQVGQTGRIVFLTPVRDLRSVNISFPMPTAPVPDMEHTSRMLSHTLGYEGEGSLLSALKARGWANGLSAGSSDFKQCSYFNMSVSLTPEGLVKLDELVRIVLESIRVLDLSSDADWARLHGEVRQTAENSVRFRPTTEPVSAVTSLATALIDYDPMHILTRGLMQEAPNVIQLRDQIACLVPSNMILFVSAQGFGPEKAGNGEGAETIREPFYGFEYSVAPFSASQRSMWGMASTDPVTRDPTQGPAARGEWTVLPSGNAFPGTVDLTKPNFDATASATYGGSLTIPPPNPFIPSDFTIKSLPFMMRGASGMPERVKNEDNCVETGAVQTESSVGVQALQSGMPSPVTVDVIVAESPSPAALAAAPTLFAEGADPSSVPEVEDKVQVPSFPMLLECSAWDTPFDPLSTLPGLQELPIRHNFTSTVLPFPSVYPQPQVIAVPAAGEVDQAAPVLRAWYHQDGVFRLPKTYMTARLQMPAGKAAGGDAFKRGVASLSSSIMVDLLAECTYDAGCAGLGYDFHAAADTGVLYFGVSGYSHTLPILLKTVLARTVAIADMSEDALRPTFDRLKDSYVRSLANFSKAQPQARARDLVHQYLLRPHINRDAALAAAARLTLDHVRNHMRGMVAIPSAQEVDTMTSRMQVAPGALLPVPVEVLVSGNTDLNDATSFARVIQSHIPTAPTALTHAAPQIDPATGQVEFPEARTVLLRPGTTLVITRPHPNPSEPNAAVDVVWALGPATPRMRALGALLAQAWAQPAFETLRTQEQLGYIVSSGMTTLGDGGVLAAYITVQGQVASVDHLHARVDAFVEKFRASLELVTAEEFKAKAAIVAHRLTEPTKTQSEAHSRLRGPLESGRYQWNSSEAVAAAVRAASVDDLKHLYDSALIGEARLLRKVVARVYAQHQPACVKEGDAPVHDGGPSKVPAPHPNEAPERPEDLHRRVIVPRTFLAPDAALGVRGGDSVPAGTWMPLLQEIPSGIRMQ